MYKDSEKGEIVKKGEKNISDINTWGELDIGGRDMTKRNGSIKIFEHTSRGSKLTNLYGAFECAYHMFACMA